MLAERGRRELDAARDGAGDHRRPSRRAAAEEKTLLQDAAVVGKVFWLGALAAVGERDRAGRSRSACTRSSARSSSAASAARRSPARPSTRSATCSCATSPTGRSRGRAGREAPARGRLDRVARGRPHEDRADMLAPPLRGGARARAGGRDARAGELAERARGRSAQRATAPAPQRFRRGDGFYEEALELWPDDDRRLRPAPVSPRTRPLLLRRRGRGEPRARRRGAPRRGRPCERVAEAETSWASSAG